MDTTTDTSERVDALVASLTLDEQAALTAGADMWSTVAIDRVGLPAVRVTDGPNGSRGSMFSGPTSACFPCGPALASTWDVDLITTVAVAMGEEARAKGARVLLAPTVNLHRHPLSGRNFECHSEDPYLASRMAVAYITGVQSTGVAATVKHFAANDAEWHRMIASSEVDERALRELYLRPFEAAVREAGAWAIMTAYNKLGGTYCSEHGWLIETLLREEWGFDGLVMSDWYGTHSTVEAAEAGLDLEMPGPTAHRGAALVAAVNEGRLEAKTVAARARRVVQLAERVGTLDEGGPEPDQSIDRPEHRALIRRASADGIVLLQNDGGLLPLDLTTVGRLAVIGPNAYSTQVQGGGSATVSPHYVVSVLDAIRARCGSDTVVTYEPGCSLDRGMPPLDLRRLADGLSVSYINGDDPRGPVVHTETAHRATLRWLGDPAPGVTAGHFAVRAVASYIASATGVHSWSLQSAGRSRLLIDGELVVDNWEPKPGGDQFFGAGSIEAKADLALVEGQAYDLVVEAVAPEGPIAGIHIGCQPPIPQDPLGRAVALAADSDAVILVVGTTPQWESEGFDRRSLDLPGDQPELIARVAAVNCRCAVILNTGAPIAAPWADKVAAVAQVWFGGQEVGNAAVDVITGAVNPAGRLPTSYPVRLSDAAAFLDVPGEDERIRYSEGVFMGYRWHDKREIAPRWCFGHGLSYTTFGYADLTTTVTRSGPAPSVSIALTVTNTGDHAGQEVVQVYVGGAPTPHGISRPVRELRAFTKVSLDPGATVPVGLTLSADAFTRWDPTTHGWVIDPGEYEITVGASSRDLRLTSRVTIDPES